ncbi:GAF domain-containing sensor histidine kinase [Gillisia limnaea]|uniref:histidine kinase n=1 Tax=Gillisia limnaea (strain DSM 15749 / LMG 21470 / R-8282) TaxID=865937 RepID=H2BWY1_GILLR|nr:GAF domain-containing sensor histidine kinase [Gillisia limnaea]EHQ04154.1 GAF sensor signal transduction histidine kinase [Gillisia limnaea DSM 15749]
MIEAELPHTEKKRLAALEELQLLHTDPEENYDDITKLASYICNVPVSLITLIGKEQQWFKSKVGTDLNSAPRAISHCSHAILNPKELMEVKDTREDLRFENNPYTVADPKILFYAGMPLKSFNGNAIGTLCVLDTKPNSLNDDQKSALKALARQVENLFELRRHNLKLENVTKVLKEKNSQLKDFAGTVSHDMKMPLANMILTADMIKAKYADKFDEDGIKYLNYLKQSSFKLSSYITGILQHYESDSLTESIIEEEFDIHDLLEEIIDLLNIDYECIINLPEENLMMNCNRIALEQIILNLVSNSLKYNKTEEIVIDIECRKDHEFYHFTVKDNGIGIPKDKQEDIFELFTIIEETDRSGNKGNGIGLSTVKKLVNYLGGEISVDSDINKGTSFHFSINHTICDDDN